MKKTFILQPDILVRAPDESVKLSFSGGCFKPLGALPPHLSGIYIRTYGWPGSRGVGYTITGLNDPFFYRRMGNGSRFFIDFLPWSVRCFLEVFFIIFNPHLHPFPFLPVMSQPVVSHVSPIFSHYCSIVFPAVRLQRTETGRGFPARLFRALYGASAALSAAGVMVYMEAACRTSYAAALLLMLYCLAICLFFSVNMTVLFRIFFFQVFVLIVLCFFLMFFSLPSSAGGF